MKKIFKTKKFLIPFMMFCFMLFGSVAASAATPKIARTKTVYAAKYYSIDKNRVAYNFRGMIKLSGMKSTDKITSVKTSMKGVTAAALDTTFKAKANTYKKKQSVYFYNTTQQFKPGKSFTITAKVRRGSKTYTSKCTVKIKTAPTVIKSIKIGSVTAVTNMGDGECTARKTPDFSGKLSGRQKISIKAASGIKIKSITIGGSKKIRNNSTCEFTAGEYYSIIITYTTSKSFANDWSSKENTVIYDFLA